MIDGLFADGIRWQWSAIDRSPSELYDEERAAISKARPKRAREFATGRLLARSLLSQLGVTSGPLLQAADRAPLWPGNVVGSISHCDDRCLVAVARANDVSHLGIDIEPSCPLEQTLWEEILDDRDLGQLAQRPREQQGLLAKRIFGAKEAVYKAVSKHFETPLDFDEIRIEPVSGICFSAHPTSSRTTRIKHLLEQADLRWTATGRWLAASMTVSQSVSAARSVPTATASERSSSLA